MVGVEGKTVNNNGCKLCARGVGLEPELSQRDMAQKYGVGKSSVARHRKHYSARNQVEEHEADLWTRNGISPDDYEVERMSILDKSTGSWVKVRRTRDAVEALSYDDLAHLWDEPVPQVPLSSNRLLAEVLLMADLQIGKAGEKGGGTKETLQRVRNSVAAFRERVRKSQPSHIVLVDMGDPIENVFNTPDQAFTNDLDLPEQIRVARRAFAEAIRELADYAPSVIFVSVPSNHGQFRTGFRAAGGTVDADFGLEINYSLEEQFADRPGFEHVTFVRPDPLDDTAQVEVAGSKIAFNHGYESRGTHKHGEWWAKRDHGRMTGWDADILCMAHYHNMGLQQSGNGRWIICAASVDPGSGWFQRKTGESALSGMTAFGVEKGQWQNIALL